MTVQVCVRRHVERTEPARVDEPDESVAEVHSPVFVLAVVGAARPRLHDFDDHASRHAEVDHRYRRSGPVEARQDVFGSSVERRAAPADQPLQRICRHRPAQVLALQVNSADAPADQMRRSACAYSFDFGQLWQGPFILASRRSGA